MLEVVYPVAEEIIVKQIKVKHVQLAQLIAEPAQLLVMEIGFLLKMWNVMVVNIVNLILVVNVFLDLPHLIMEDVDQQVGQVLAALRRAGQEENTLVVFTSDHGEGLGSHRWTGKMMYYEEEAAVPLIVSWKGVTPAGRIDRDHLASALDVLPTICDYAGIKGPAVMRGKGLRSVIDKPAIEAQL